jgi:hypothetical protein
MLIYLATLALLWAAWRGGSDRAGRGARMASPRRRSSPHANFFGGETCLGNRYLLAAAVPVVRAARLSRAARAPPGSPVGAGGLGASRSWRRASDPGSQNHAYAGLFRWLPANRPPAPRGAPRPLLGGRFRALRRPVAEVDRASFRLTAGEPASSSRSPPRGRLASLLVTRTRLTAYWWSRTGCAAADPAPRTTAPAPAGGRYGPPRRVHLFW